MFTLLIDKGVAIITNTAYDWLIDCGEFASIVKKRMNRVFEQVHYMLVMVLLVEES